MLRGFAYFAKKGSDCLLAWGRIVGPHLCARTSWFMKSDARVSSLVEVIKRSRPCIVSSSHLYEIRSDDDI